MPKIRPNKEPAASTREVRAGTRLTTASSWPARAIATPSTSTTDAGATETSTLSTDLETRVETIVQRAIQSSMTEVATQAAQQAIALQAQASSAAARAPAQAQIPAQPQAGIPTLAPTPTPLAALSVHQQEERPVTAESFIRLSSSLFPQDQTLFQGTESGVSLDIPQQHVRSVQSGEFSELDKLLPYNLHQVASETTSNVSLTIDKNEELKLVRNKVKKRITTISEWTDAFILYIKILIQKFPARYPELINYLEII